MKVQWADRFAFFFFQEEHTCNSLGLSAGERDKSRSWEQIYGLFFFSYGDAIEAYLLCPNFGHGAKQEATSSGSGTLKRVAANPYPHA